MAAWSCILRSKGENVLRIGSILAKNGIQATQVRNMGHGPRLFRIEPTRWQWKKTKDLFHFYTLIGVIPLTIITFVTYIYVGPATLQPIPEGYAPKHWEYYRNPITRFIMKYFNQSHQECYERTLAVLYDESRRAEITGLQKKVQRLIKQRKDYQAYYYIPYNAEHVYEAREFNDNYEAALPEIHEKDKQLMREGKFAEKTEV